MTDTRDLWIVIGNQNNWGTGTTFPEAIRNAFKNGKDMAECHVYYYEDLLPDQKVWVNDMGGISMTADGIKGKKLLNVKIPAKLTKAFSAFDEEVDELRYGPEFDAAFDQNAGNDEVS